MTLPANPAPDPARNHATTYPGCRCAGGALPPGQHVALCGISPVFDALEVTAQLDAARARVRALEGAVEDSDVILKALGSLHATQLIRQGRTDGRDDFGPEVRAASDRWRAFRALAARGE